MTIETLTKQITSLPRNAKVGVAGAALILTLATVLLLRSSAPIKEGDVYLRYGLPDSALVATILEAAPNASGQLLAAILAFDRPIQVDKIGGCIDMLRHYEADSLLLTIPLFIPDEDEECWSYRIRFDIQDGDNMIPIRLSLIHPDEHAFLLSKPESEGV